MISFVTSSERVAKPLRISVFCFAVAWLLSSGALHGETIHIFLVGGQSNADGRASLSGLPANLQAPQADIAFYSAIDKGSPTSAWGVPTSGGTLSTLHPGESRTGDLGPEVTFGRSMADFYAPAGQKIAIIKFAGGGTNLYSQWLAGGTSGTTGDGSVYRNFQTIVSNGLSALQAANPTATLTINGMIWMQGESDADTTAHSQAYQTNLTNFISDVRLTYGANLPFVLGELSSGQTGTGSGNNTANDITYRNNVRSAQVAVDTADPFTKLVNTDTYGLNADHLHFNNAAQQAFGYALASQMQTLVVVPEPSTTALLGITMALLGMVGNLRLRRKLFPPRCVSGIAHKS